jgi:glycosyltransferase involved in cell wall biosynthesis
MSVIDDRPLVSVVIAAFNMGNFVAQTVESVTNSSYGNLEIIVVDDGSTDNTKDAIDSLLSDNRVRYIYQENAGQTRAKNRGVEESSGAFIAFCDADDYWVSEKLELQLPFFDEPKVGVVYSEVSYVNDKGELYEKPAPYERFSGKVTEQLLLKNFVPFGTAIFRRECITVCGGFNEQYKMGIDWDLWLRYSLKWEFAYLPVSTYVYREWDGQMSNNHRGRYESAFLILSNFEAEFGKEVESKALKKAWADNYISRGVLYAKKEGLITKPILDVLKGLRITPTAMYGWKALLKILLRRL